MATEEWGAASGGVALAVGLAGVRGMVSLRGAGRDGRCEAGLGVVSKW